MRMMRFWRKKTFGYIHSQKIEKPIKCKIIFGACKASGVSRAGKTSVNVIYI